jgi:hypothetical protein
MALKSVSRAAFGATAILTSAILLGPGVSSTEAATNFNKNGNCRLIETAEGIVNTCLCPPVSQLRKQRPLPGSALTACYAAARQQATLGVPTVTDPDPDPDPTPDPDPDPTPDPDPDPDLGKANNGWGNGPDSNNPGSDDGNQTQADSKNDSQGPGDTAQR